MKHAGRIAVVCVAIALGGCEDEPPSPAEARRWYEADQTMLDAMGERVAEAVEESRLTQRADPQSEEYHGHILAWNRRLEEFRRHLPSLVTESRVIGFEVRVPTARGDETTDGQLGKVGWVPPLGDGPRVRAEDGQSVGDRQIGHGLYEVEREGGATEQRPGYEAHWEIEREPRLRMTAFVEAP